MARRAPRQEEEGARKLFDETPQPVAFSGEGKLVIWLQSSQTPCPSGNGGYGFSLSGFRLCSTLQGTKCMSNL